LLPGGGMGLGDGHDLARPVALGAGHGGSGGDQASGATP
jgi:hypothetical protein